MQLIRNCIALIRANVVCFTLRVIAPKSFKYRLRIRVFSRAQISLRNKGCINLGNNIKIDAGAVVASNGGVVNIGNDVGIGRNNIIVSQEAITIGNGTILSPNVLIYDHDHEFAPKSGVSVRDYHRSSVRIGEKCWIGANTVILRGTVIGDNCIIGAGSVIKGIFPDNSKIIQKRVTTVNGEII